LSSERTGWLKWLFTVPVGDSGTPGDPELPLSNPSGNPVTMPKTGMTPESVEGYRRRLKHAEQCTSEVSKLRDAAEARVIELRTALDEATSRSERLSGELQDAAREAKAANQTARQLNQRLVAKNHQYRGAVERSQAMAKELQTRNEGLVEDMRREVEQRTTLSDQLTRQQQAMSQLEQTVERERTEQHAAAAALRAALTSAERERDDLLGVRSELRRALEQVGALRGRLEAHGQRQVQLLQEVDDLRLLLEHIWFLSARSLDLTVGEASMVALKLAWSSLAEFARCWGKIDEPEQLSRAVGEQLARAGLVDGIVVEQAPVVGDWCICISMARHVDPPAVRWLAAYVVGCFSAGLSISLRVLDVQVVERRVIVKAALGTLSAAPRLEPEAEPNEVTA
jgi:hypothetical protein